MKTDNPIRTEPVYGTMQDLFTSLGIEVMKLDSTDKAAPADVTEPADDEYLIGYLAGINSLSGHLLDALS